MLDSYCKYVSSYYIYYSYLYLLFKALSAYTELLFYTGGQNHQLFKSKNKSIQTLRVCIIYSSIHNLTNVCAAQYFLHFQNFQNAF